MINAHYQAKGLMMRLISWRDEVLKMIDNNQLTMIGYSRKA